MEKKRFHLCHLVKCLGALGAESSVVNVIRHFYLFLMYNKISYILKISKLSIEISKALNLTTAWNTTPALLADIKILGRKAKHSIYFHYSISNKEKRFIVLAPDDGGHAHVWILLVQGVILKVEPQEVEILPSRSQSFFCHLLYNKQACL